ncbi:MAG: peptidylprolyl isomerase [Chromatiales bacterium]|jgi:peptidylprolyl isomerase
MMQAKSGDTVKVHYTGILEDGTQFDSSSGREPLEFTIGSGGIIPGFERAIVGMEQGDSKRVVIPADEAYGDRQDELVQTLPRQDIPEDISLDNGVVLEAESPNGQRMRLTVVDVDEENVTLDANHPLAGKDLTFDLELVDIA